MINCFMECSNEFCDVINRVVMCQVLVYLMSEFLGILFIVVVLWFGGLLILGNYFFIDVFIFIFYMVIFYSVINFLKEFLKVGYNIFKGLVFMECVDKILKVENKIVEILNLKLLNGLEE